jgi:hypothetical protein
MSRHEPGQTPWPELRQRILDLAGALREHGIVWRPFADRRAEAQSRRGRIPDEVAASLKDFLREILARVRGRPTAADCEWLFRRLRELWAPVREPGEVWTLIDPEEALAAQALCSHGIPSELMAEMKSLLAELRAAFRARTRKEELASFVERCREKARSDLYRFLYPHRTADLEALAERSQRERTVYCEEYELLSCEQWERPVWADVVFVEPGEGGGVELRSFLDPEMAEIFGHRSEPTMETYMSLWHLVAACEAGFEGLPAREAESSCAKN